MRIVLWPRIRRAAIASLICLTAAGAGFAATDWPTWGWLRSTPEEQGLNSAVLDGGDQYIRSQCPGRYSFLVIRNGRLVYERYYHGTNQNSSTHVMSISKSVLSILIGQALDEKVIDSLDHKFLDYYPEYVTPGMDPRKRDITLRHLITMTSGYQWDEVQTGPAWVASKDWFKFVIDLPLINQPGDTFNYSTGLSHLLAGVLAKASHRTALDYGTEHLFGPLGIWNFHWETDSHGYYIGGFRMYFTAADLAKFGYLYLRKGVWEDQQLVSRQWVEVSSSLQVHNYSSIDIGDFGYHWWFRKQWSYPVFMASGFGGQYIFVVPSLDLIMVSTADSSTDTRDLHLQAFNLFNQYVVPALQQPNTPTPSIDPQGIVNAAGGTEGIVPGGMVSIRGKNLAPSTRTWQPDDYVAGNLPTQLEGVSVTINDKPAYVAHVSPELVAVLAPADATVGAVPVIVTSAPGKSAQRTAELVKVNPALFLWDGYYAVAQHQDGSVAGPASGWAGVGSVAARPGEVITFSGTGFGATDPATPVGEVARCAAPLPELPVVRIGGAGAEVISAGISAGAAGVYQVTVRIPEDAADGDLPVVVEYGGARSPDGAYLRVVR